MSTLLQQAGQLFLIGIEASAWDTATEALLREVRPGGVIFFQRNIASPEEFAGLVRRIGGLLAEDSSLPPFLAIDLEGGTVDRLREALAPLPCARDAARAGLARELGRVAGRELAAQFGEEFLAGLSESGILGCGKHFPGLGSGRIDSHRAMPRIEKDEARLWEQDLFPFRALAPKLPMMMVAHAAYPALERAGAPPLAGSSAALPASLSRSIVSGLLKGRIGFQGLVVADDLEMGGVTGDRSVGEAAVETIRAGCDLLLVCRRADHVRAALQAVVREAERSPDFCALLTEAAEKVTRAKQQQLRPFPPDKEPFADWDGLRRAIRNLTEEVRRRLAPRSVTEKGRGR